MRKHLGGLRIVEISTGRIQRYILERQRDGLEKRNINRELAALKRMFNLGFRQTPPKVVNLPGPVPMLRENNIRKGYFEHHEFIRLFRRSPRLSPTVLAIGYCTGMRLGEIMSLRWNRSTWRNEGSHSTPGPRKMTSPRVIFMPESLFVILWERKRLRDAEFPECPDVCFRNGQKIKDFRGAWETATRSRQGWTATFPADLRRTAVRNMIRARCSRGRSDADFRPQLTAPCSTATTSSTKLT